MLIAGGAEVNMPQCDVVWRSAESCDCTTGTTGGVRLTLGHQDLGMQRFLNCNDIQFVDGFTGFPTVFFHHSILEIGGMIPTEYIPSIAPRCLTMPLLLPAPKASWIVLGHGYRKSLPRVLWHQACRQIWCIISWWRCRRTAMKPVAFTSASWDLPEL